MNISKEVYYWWPGYDGIGGYAPKGRKGDEILCLIGDQSPIDWTPIEYQKYKGWEGIDGGDNPGGAIFPNMLLSQRACTVLGHELKDLGIFLSCVVDGDPTYSIFHPTRIVDCFDERIGVFKGFGDIYAFHKEKVPATGIFLVPQDATAIFTTRHFVELIRKHKLTGFKFTKVWSSETGPMRVKVINGDVALVPLEQSSPD